MAAREYYLGTQAAHELPDYNQTNLYPQPTQAAPQYQPPPVHPYPRQHYNAPVYTNPPPSTYAVFPPQPAQQQQVQAHLPQQHYPANGAQAPPAPYPQTPLAAPYFQPLPQQQNGYLGAPLQPVRSHSQPARVRFADQESDRSTDIGSTSDSDDSPRRHRRHHRHRSHSHDSDTSDRERDRSHRHGKTDKKERKNRDTFLGAGAGTIIGDAIFPGLGTAAGLLLGGYSGRKYAERSHSEEPHHHRHRDAFREGQEKGRRDMEDAGYKSGRKHRNAYRDGKEEGRRDREYKKRGEEYDSSDSDDKRSTRGHRRHGGSGGWDEESATFKRGFAVR